MERITIALLVLTFLGASYGDTRRALLIIDVQKCFISGGNLAVAGGDEVVPVINEIRRKYEGKFHSVYLSQDFHPPNSVSFASQHVDKLPFDSVTLKYNVDAQLCRPTTLKEEDERSTECDAVATSFSQMLWPDHCVNGTGDANLADDLFIDPLKDKVVFKGTNPSIDSYSAFYGNGHLQQTGLGNSLQFEHIEELFVVGLATDFCVHYTAVDGVLDGYKVYVVLDATRYVTEATYQEALSLMNEKGVHIINSSQLENILGAHNVKISIRTLLAFVIIIKMIY